MGTRHVSTPIAVLLEKTDKYLAEFFQGNGKEIRQILKQNNAKGDVWIGSEGCNHFDPKEGCQCHLYNEDGTANHKSPFQ